VPHYFPTCGGVASSATELTAVLANLAPVGALWRVLCSYKSSFEGGGVVVGRPAAAAGWFEGAVNRGAVSYGPPWAHYLGGYQDRLLGGPLGLPGLCRTVPVGVRRKDYGGEVLG
jgi:hypothetical protein